MVTAPDGTKAPAVDPESGQSFFGWNTNDQGKTIPAYGPKEALTEPSAIDDITVNLGKGARNTLHGAAAFGDLVSLPISTLMRVLGIDVQPLAQGADQLSDNMGLPQLEGGADELSRAIYDGAIAGLGTAGAGAALSSARGVTGAIGSQLAKTPVADAVAGGTGNAAADVTRQAGGGPIAQFTAALTGGGIGALASQAPRAASSMRMANRTPTEYAKAASDLGIDIVPADAGGPTTRRLSAAAVQAPFSAAPIVKAGQRLVDQAKAAQAKIAGAFAEPGTREKGGEAARKGALEYIKNSGKQGGRFYDKAGDLAGNARVALPKAIAAVDEQIARLKEVPGGGEGLADLEALRKGLEREGGFSVQGVRDMRTEMFVAPELRGSPAERRLKQVVDAAAEDIRDGLRDQGLEEAAEAFQAADQYWQTRLETIDKFIRPIIGKDDVSKGGEDIFKAINAAASGNAERLHRFMSVLPEEDANLVRATLINRLGLAKKGGQNADVDAFSLETFLSNWAELEPRAKTILFGAEARDALQKLAMVAEQSRNASAYANKSQTAGGVIGQSVLTGGAGLLGLKTLGTMLATQYGAGKMLASPRFARWLASAPKKPNPAATRAHIGRLAAIGAAEPTIDNEVLLLQNRLMEAFSAQPLAAEEGGQ